MAEYKVEQVQKNENGYQLICNDGERKGSKTLPIIEGFEPKASDTLQINRRSKGEMDVSVLRGEYLLADFHTDRKTINFNIYREEGVDKYSSGSLQPNAVRRAKHFADHLHNIAETKLGKINLRQAAVVLGMAGMFASLGTDLEYAQAVNMAPEEIKDGSLMGMLVCGTTAVLGVAKGAGHELLDAAARKYIEKKGIKIYGPQGKVVKVVSGLDQEGNPTGSFYNKGLVMARGGRNG